MITTRKKHAVNPKKQEQKQLSSAAAEATNGPLPGPTQTGDHSNKVINKPAQNKTQPARAQGWTENSFDWNTPPSDHQLSPSPAPIALRAKALRVNFGSNCALQDLSFDLHSGDTLGLLGLNGAGKSTLLKVLSGALAPGRGTVHIGDKELYEDQIEARMNLGYAPDKPAIYPEFKVREFLSFIARMRRIPRAQIASAVDDVMQRCVLTKVHKRIIGNLSSGYQQRVNLAQALIHTPRVLILDEPSNGLDPVQMMEMRELVTNLTDDQATIFSSHLLSEVETVCNRVILIHSGRQVLDTSITSTENNTTFEVTLASGTDLDLTEVPGVTDACRLTDTHWMVAGNSLTEAHLQTMLTTRGLNVSGITASENYLESVFKQLAPIKISGAIDSSSK